MDNCELRARKLGTTTVKVVSVVCTLSQQLCAHTAADEVFHRVLGVFTCCAHINKPACGELLRTLFDDVG